MEHDAGSSKSMVTLVSRDDERFELPLAAAMHAKLVRNSFGGDEDDDDDVEQGGELAGSNVKQEVQLMRVGGEALKRVVDFLNHYHEEPMNEITVPITGNSFDEVMQQHWYRMFVSEANMPDGTLFEVLAAANYMEIQPLLDLACLRITFSLQGKNAEEIRKALNLPDLSPEDEATAREEHPWIFEDNSS